MHVTAITPGVSVACAGLETVDAAQTDCATDKR